MTTYKLKITNKFKKQLKKLQQNKNFNLENLDYVLNIIKDQLKLVLYNLIISLYVTKADKVSNKIIPTDWSIISNFLFNGLLIIPSTISNTFFPPSSGGNGSKFVTPSDNDTTDNKYIKSAIELVLATALDMPTGPAIWSIPTLSVNSSTILWNIIFI